MPRKRVIVSQNLPKQDFIQIKVTKIRNQTIMIRRMRSELKVMFWPLIRRQQVRHFKLFWMTKIRMIKMKPMRAM